MNMMSKLIAVIVFCAIAGATVVSVSSRQAKGQTVSGSELFAENCARCHGADGSGGKGPNLTSEKRQTKWRESDEKLIKKISGGGMFMPSFGKKLKADQIKAIATHVRTLKDQPER